MKMVMNMKKDSVAKQQIMTRLNNVLKGQAMYVREDDSISDRDRLTQADVILDLMNFLNDYDKNIEVLNRYWHEKRQREKFKQEDREI